MRFAVCPTSAPVIKCLGKKQLNGGKFIIVHSLYSVHYEPSQ